MKKVIKNHVNHLTDYFHFLVIIGICAINLIISGALRSSDVFFVSNPTPISFSLGYYSSIFILILASYLIIKFEFLKKSPVYSIFILAGLYSNFIEKLIWNNVADYLMLGNLNLNLADTQIFVGIVMVNIEIWLKDRKAKPYTTQIAPKKIGK
jgi:hypothetical protein